MSTSALDELKEIRDAYICMNTLVMLPHLREKIDELLLYLDLAIDIVEELFK